MITSPSDNFLQILPSKEENRNAYMATKLKVIFQRIEAKDYLDLAVMIQEGVSLSKG
ncbi:MAG TPA: hypothetical protein VJK54_03200 [Chthoniobacterales bacterium]|nr:hypothetical protein [Chthoniobacterales bacterium]